MMGSLKFNQFKTLMKKRNLKALLKAKYLSMKIKRRICFDKNIKIIKKTNRKFHLKNIQAIQ
jgi:Holliday junction resolvasome RuvABC DNA-binding subunit